MAEEKIRLPATTAGLTRYFEEYKEQIQIKPEMVVAFIIGVIAFEVLLRLYFFF